MLSTTGTSNISAPTQFLNVGDARYAYRRLGAGSSCRVLYLQHFTGTLDNWDPAVTDPLASDREVILFDNAGIGGSSGTVPRTIGAMADHALKFIDGAETRPLRHHGILARRHGRPAHGVGAPLAFSETDP